MFKFSTLQLIGIIATVATTFALGMPNVYPPKAKADTSWTKEDNAAMIRQCPPINTSELGKHNRTSPLTMGLK